MKNEKKRSCLKQYTAGYPLWIIAVLLLLSNCDGGSSLVPVPEPHSETEDSEVISGSELAPNIKLLIKYDEKTYSFATKWPADIVAGAGKAKDEHSEMLLETYENRRVRMEYDTSGVLSEFGSWPEGDASRSIPKEVYEELKNEMPAHSQDYDPIVRWQIVDGMISYFSQSGQAVLSTEVQEEESRHSAVSARIDSVIKANKLPLAERIDRNALTMKSRDYHLKRWMIVMPCLM